MSLACTVTAIISLIAPAMDLVWSSANGRSPGFLSEEIIWHQLSRATDEDRNGLASNLNSSLANYQKKTDESRDRCGDGRVDDRKLLTQRRVSELIADAVRFSKKKTKNQRHFDIPQPRWWTCLDVRRQLLQRNSIQEKPNQVMTR